MNLYDCMFIVSLSPKSAMCKKPVSLHEKVALLNFLLVLIKKIASDNFIKMKNNLSTRFMVVFNVLEESVETYLFIR